jgi:hypothetical protein
MNAISSGVLLFEGGFAVVFLTLLLLERKKGGGREDILWGLVWATRLVASLGGSRHLNQDAAGLSTYIALQACSGLSLMVVLARYELKAFRERLFRRLVLQVNGAGTSGSSGQPRKVEQRIR